MSTFLKTANSTVLLCCTFLIAIITPSCKKDIHQPDAVAVSGQTAIPAGYMMTPVGLMRIQDVHTIEPGFAVAIRNGHALKIRQDTREQTEDWGEIKGGLPASILSHRLTASGNTSLPSGYDDPNTGYNWVTGTEYAGNGQPIMYFSTNYSVPVAPEDPGPLFYIWSGISPSPSSYPLIQPVLQWGSNGAFGGEYWTVANWCVFSPTLAAISPNTPALYSGTNLQGIVNCYNYETANNSYDYTSYFYYNGSNQNILNVEYNTTYNKFGGGTGVFPTIPGTLTNAYEVLEVPGYTTTAYQYPNQENISMNSISLKTGTTNSLNSTSVSTVNWTTFKEADLGENTTIVNSDGTGDGQIDIWFY